MDVVVGHFGYLHFISSSELVFPFPREIASYARNLVKRAAIEREASSGVNSYQCHQQQQQQQQGPMEIDVRGQDVLQPARPALPPEVSNIPIFLVPRRGTYVDYACTSLVLSKLTQSRASTFARIGMVLYCRHSHSMHHWDQVVI